MTVDVFVVAQIAGLTAGVFAISVGLGKWLHRQMQEQAKPLWARIDELRAESGRNQRELADYKLAVAKEYATVQALADMRRDMDDRFIRLDALIRAENATTRSAVDRLAGMLMQQAPRAE